MVGHIEPMCVDHIEPVEHIEPPEFADEFWIPPRAEPVLTFEYTPSEDLALLEKAEDALELLLEDEPIGLTEADVLEFLKTSAVALDTLLQLDEDDCLKL